VAVFFSAKELLQFAIGIERNGAMFYRKLCAETQNKDIKSILNHLLKDEEKHERIFQDMVAVIGEFQPTESYPGEYMQYLQSLIDSTVFTDIADAQHKAEQICDTIEALDIGIQAEKDSIVFYSEMQKLARQADQKTIQEIIDEEKSHLRQLAELKKINKEDEKWQWEM
jgi:rubrerythrin